MHCEHLLPHHEPFILPSLYNRQAWQKQVPPLFSGSTSLFWEDILEHKTLEMIQYRNLSFKVRQAWVWILVTALHRSHPVSPSSYM